MDFHICNLEELCRICSLQKGLRRCDVNDHKNDLKEHFILDTFSDKLDIHPTSMFFKCATSLRNAKSRLTRTSSQSFAWQAHNINCQVCHTSLAKSKGGRPKKIKKVARKTILQ